MKRKRKKKKTKYEKSVLLLVLAVVVGVIVVAIAIYYTFITYVQPALQSLPEVSTVPELSIVGYTEVVIGLNITDDRGIVYLDGDCYELSMVISKAQAVSIEDGINGIIRARPNTHDLMKDMLKNLDANILMIKVVELKNGTYHARFVLRKDNLVLSLDSRPSDALAIAARTDYTIPVYVESSLLESFGREIC